MVNTALLDMFAFSFQIIEKEAMENIVLVKYTDVEIRQNYDIVMSVLVTSETSHTHTQIITCFNLNCSRRSHISLDNWSP